jgi:hypothetical protein
VVSTPRMSVCGVSPDLATMIAQVAGLREVWASRSTPTEELLAQIDDALSEGYAWALTSDGRSMRTEQRLHELVSNTLVSVADGHLRALAREDTRFSHDLVALRRELAALRRERDRLRADWRASSG